MVSSASGGRAPSFEGRLFLPEMLGGRAFWLRSEAVSRHAPALRPVGLVGVLRWHRDQAAANGSSSNISHGGRA